MRSSNLIFGVGLVALGVLFLLDNFGMVHISFENLWPFFLLFGGIGFWAGFFADRKNIGLVMPGTILTVYGLLFLYCSVYGWYFMEYGWPFFMIGPGLGFFAMYFLGTHDKGLLIPAFILTIIGAVFLTRFEGVFRLWPLVLIVMGLLAIFRHRKQVEN